MYQYFLFSKQFTKEMATYFGRYKENISKDTQEIPQSRSTPLPRHKMKERLGTNKDKTNVTY